MGGLSLFWIWLVAGMALFAAETVAPGMFLLWIGAAAIATGLLTAAVDLSLPWTLLAFGGFAIVAVILGRKVYGSRETPSDQPFLNRRADAMVGKTYTLTQPIRGGEGRLVVNDTSWRLRGPDMPAGVRVVVLGVEDAVVLLVEQA